MASRRWVLGVGLILFPLGGCLAEVPETATDASSSEAPSIVGGIRIEAKDCVQAAGNSAFQGPRKIGPFDSANQLPEIGNPVVGGLTVFLPGDESWGIWHVATACSTYTYNDVEYEDLRMGWIAVLIERPDFDVWGSPRIQFMVADQSFNNEAFVDASKDATGGVEISLATDMLIEWLVPDRYMHVIIAEANHGTFQFMSEITKKFAEKETEHIRFWMLPSADGSGHAHGASTDDARRYRPISIDVFDTARPGARKLAGEDLGPFVHLNGAERHQGNVVGHYWDRFDRVIELGPAPDEITFDKTWLH